MRKRLCAGLLSFIMFLSLLPTTVLAAEDGPVTTTNSADNLTLTKTVTPEDDGTYTVRLESYATGTVTTTTTTTPLDIVLLLDVSGSMKETFTPAASEFSAVYAESLDTGKTYYVKKSGLFTERNVEVTYCTTCEAWTRGCWTGMTNNHHVGSAYTPKTSAEDTDETHTQFYEYSYTPAQSKLDALKVAVNSFIDGVAESSPNSNISIVKFADNSNKDSVGNDFTEEGYNYTQIVKELTGVNESGVAALKTSVASLKAAGATASDYGLTMAATALKDAKQEKIVILFTDGDPNHSSGFDYRVAADAVNKAKELKGKQTTIYTVGIFTNPSNDINMYMSSVSSNHPGASAEVRAEQSGGPGGPSGPGGPGGGNSQSGWTVTDGGSDAGKYYLNTTSAADLLKAFQTISSAVSSTTLDSSAVVVDTVPANFTAPADAANVKVYTASCTGKGTDGVLTWGSDTASTLAPTIAANTDGSKTISVTGFDFSANWCGLDGQNAAHGQKLILEFTISRTNYGGTQPTNAGACVTDKDGKSVISVGDPTVPVQIEIVSDAVAGWKEEKVYDASGFELLNQLAAKADALVSGTNAGQNACVNMDLAVTVDNTTYTYRIPAGATTGSWYAGTSETAMTAAAVTAVKTPADVKRNESDHSVETYGYDFTLTLSDATATGAESCVLDAVANFKINPLAVVVTADNKMVSAGTAPSDIEYTYQVSPNMLNEDKVQCKIGSDYTAAAAAGKTFDITVTGNQVQGNYTVTYQPGTLTVTESKYSLTYDANGGFFGTTEVTTKNETVNSAGSHALNYTDDFTPIHAVVSKEDVIFLGWSSTQRNSIVGFDDAKNAAEIADSIITSVNVTENGAYVYAVWGYDSNENDIPDVFEATIIYKIENGQWTNNNHEQTGTDPITAVFELYTQQDDHSWKATDKVLRHGNFPIGHQGNVGYTGQGWYRNVETDPTDLVKPNTKVIDAVTGAETTFTYRYAEKAAETYTVVLHLGGGSYTTAPDGYTSNSDGTYQYSVQASDVIAPAEPAQDSYVLTGWSLTSSVPQTLIGSESKFSELYLQQGGFTSGSKKIDLYAVWEESEPDDPGTILNVLNAHVFKTFQSANSNSTTGTFTATAEVSMIAAPETDALQLEPGDPEPEYQFVGEYSGTVTLSTGSRKNFSFTAEENVRLESDTTYMVSVTEDTSNLSSYVTCAQPTVTFTFETNESGEVTCRDYSITNTYTYKWVDDSDDEDTYYFAIEKIDAQDSHTLNGAKFGLYLDGKQIATATSNRSGIAMFRVYESDYRKITAKSNLYYQELTAPEGYVVSNDKIDIEKSDLTTSQTTAEKKAETVRNYRSSTPDLLNGDDHFTYVIGYEDGSVRPNGLISRAETTTIFFRLLKDSVRDGNLLTSNTYTDVPNNYWANTAISTMTGLGIVQGRSSTTFDPQAPITRAEFAAICARFDTGTSSGTQTFSDISGHWAEKYIQRAAELGWIKGYADGTFRPDTYITRAEAMTMINRVLNRIPEETSDLLSNMNVWPDCNPSDWFYLAVQEATNSHDFKHKAGNYETWTGMNVDPNWTRYEN